MQHYSKIKLTGFDKGKKNTKYFMGLEKQKGYNQGINVLYGDKKEVIILNRKK